MNYIARGLVLSAIAVVVFSIPLLAHHGGASFDNTKEVTVKGIVTEWLWANPTDIASRGYQRRTFKPGDQVTAVVTPVKNGAPVGRLKTVTLPDGRTL